MNFLVIILSYILGSINFAYIMAKVKGIDISSLGSGNPGTSNALRTLGKGSAVIVLLGDLLKGALPILFFYEDQYFLIYGVAAVLGHIYPIFYKFKGGKGVATYLGVYIATVLKKDSAKYFRITVLGGGCAGFRYKFDFENLKNEDDILIHNEKIDVIIDETSMELIQNSKIDYVHELIGSSFKITNPQATSSCGCGTSFSI